MSNIKEKGRALGLALSVGIAGLASGYALGAGELPVFGDRLASSETPGATPSPELGEVVRGEGFSLTAENVPNQVPRNRLDIAKGTFENTIGLGTESFIAEPGTLLVGPDFWFDENRPTGEIDQKLEDAHGHIEYYSAVNTSLFETEGPSFFNVPEGGYMVASGSQMTIKVEGYEINLEGREGHNWLAVVRGRHADGERDSDLNQMAEFTDYVPGHTVAFRYPAGEAGFTGGFVSEGQFKQLVETSHNGQTNCGAEGCSEVSVILFDMNTGAFSVITQIGPNAPWTLVATNIAGVS